MNNINETLELQQIIEKLKEYSATEAAKIKFDGLRPYIRESELRNRLAETSEARRCLDQNGTPPMSAIPDIRKLTDAAGRGEMLAAEDLDEIRQFAVAGLRLKKYLERAAQQGIGLGSYADGFDSLTGLRDEIERCIRNNRVDEYASKELKTITKKLEAAGQAIQAKLEGLLRTKRECFSEHFISNRNGCYTLPVKKEHKHKISGSVIDISASGATYFIEPSAAAKLRAEYEMLHIEKGNEEKRILYTLSAMAGDCADVILQNLSYMEELDYIFARGKLSQELDGREAAVNTERRLYIKNGRHPMLPKTDCVPLTASLDEKVRGIVITGPNTGGKTVALKTIGLLSAMTCCGLHIPCEEGDICMNSQILCDIGDGQSISENLSTFSAHIKNVIEIIGKVSEDTLVLMDELGSGTDPSEGMGIAVAILEELKRSGCHFVATTHYPEVKEYAEESDGMTNARMAFDKETLKPLYRLEMGAAGESCALYIAKHLGMPRHMLERAYEETYTKGRSRIKADMQADFLDGASEGKKTSRGGGIVKAVQPKKTGDRAFRFNRGDSVVVYPQKKLGIVFQTADEKGDLIVQIRKEKFVVNHKRLQLKASAEDLYPKDYDFATIFEPAEVRKAKKVMSKRHEEGMEVTLPSKKYGKLT